MEEQQQSNDKENSYFKPRFNWIYFIISLVLIFFWMFGFTEPAKEITWKEFSQEMLVKGDVKKVNVVNNERVEVTIIRDSLNKKNYRNAPKNRFTNEFTEGPQYFFNIGSVDVFNEDLGKIQKDHPELENLEIRYEKRENWIGQIMMWLLPFGLLIFFWYFAMRRVGRNNSMFNFGRAKAKVFDKGSKTNVTFDDVAGLEEAKKEIYELVTFLKAPEKYRKLGAKIPKGILLSGPPGSGKTLLARAVAGEAEVPFFSLSGSEFVEMFVGVGAARIRDLFQQAKAKAPSIVFIDEIDAIGRARGGAQVFQANEERESTLNQLLSELDGFDNNTGVIVLAATNRGDILDPALLRPGRFDRHIHLELPNLNERKAIFKVHMRPLKLAEDIDIDILAAETPGFSGADISNICNEAALIAARNDKSAVYLQDFHDAVERVMGGLERRSKVISPEEKKRIAYHESGHVIAGWFLENAPAALKVTIIPRGKSLGAAWYLPEERQIITRSQFEDNICMALGGRAAEDVIYEDVSSNALDDLEKVTKQAYVMVTNYGLSDILKHISYYDSTGRMESSFQKPFSEKTAEMIDTEVERIVDEAYIKVKNLLLEHREQLDKLAGELAKKEVLGKKEIEAILGKRKTTSEEDKSPE